MEESKFGVTRSFIDKHICSQLDVTGNSLRSSYAKQSFTKILEQTSWVLNDRP